MVKGNTDADNYAQTVNSNTGYEKQFLESRNTKGVKCSDILDMNSENDLIDQSNENIIKNEQLIISKYGEKNIKQNTLKKYQNI